MKRTYGLLLFFFFAVDRLTKILAVVFMPDAVLINQKAFFFVFFLFVVLLGLWLFHEVTQASHMSLTATAATFMAAGALSNFFDMVRYGGIIDWIAIPGITVFNLADAFIVTGCALVLFSFFRKKKV